MIHVPYRASSLESNVLQEVKEASDTIADGADWGLITYGLQTGHFRGIAATLGSKAQSSLKASIHFCPKIPDGQEALLRNEKDEYIP